MWFIIKKILAFLWPWHRQKRAWPWRRKLMVILTVLAIIASLSLILLWPKSGVGDYGRGNYQAALEKFLNQQVHEPQNKDAAYNAANTYYRLQQNEAAEKIFSSLKDDQDPALAFEAQYNLGDTLYQEGKLGESLEAFEQAAKLNPDDKDTQDNIAFLREEIKKRMQQNQQRQQQQQ